MSENYYVKSTFDDFDDMAEALRHWNIEIRQLEQGKIDDTIVQLKVNCIIVGYAQFTGKTHQLGQIPPGRTFAFHRGKESKLLWRKKDIPLDGLMIFPPGDKLDVVTKGAFNNPHTISVPEDVLMARLTAREKEIYRQLVSTQDLLIIPKPELENLQSIFDKYFQSVEENTELIHLKSFQVCFEEELLSALLAALLSKQCSEDNDIPLQNSTIWERLEDYIEANKCRAIKVSELSKSIKVSERSLYRLFDERFAVSPKAYLNKLRLNGVRLDLKKSSASETKITDIANDWGFWHMGQFAADYKKLFGELPSQTPKSD